MIPFHLHRGALLGEPLLYLSRTLFAVIVLLLGQTSTLFAEEGELKDLASTLSSFEAGSTTPSQMVDGILLQLKRYPEVPLPENVIRLKTNPLVVTAVTLQAFQFVQQALSDGEFATASAGETLIRTFLPPGDETLRRLDKVLSVSEEAEHLESTGKIEELLGLYRDFPDLLKERVQRAIHGLVQRSVTQGSPAEAARALAIVPEELLSPVLRSDISAITLMLRDRLTGGALSFDIFERESRIRDFLPWAAEKDPGLRVIVLELLADGILASVEQGKIFRARLLFSEVIKIRKDPDSANNELRKRIIFSAKSAEARSFAAGRIDELKAYGDYPFSFRVELLLRGYYGKFFPYLLSGILLFVLGSFLSYLFLPRFRQLQIPLPRFSFFQRLIPKLRPPAQRGPGYLSPASGDDEYGGLLTVFGLKDSATEEDIKRAYRLFTKELHPDKLNPGDPEYEVQIDKFRRMQQTYDRLIEIRKSWFGNR